MGLVKVRAYLNSRGMAHQYFTDDGCGSFDFIHIGLSYHIWEFPPEENGAESNVRTAGRMEVFTGDYEAQIIEILKTW